MPFYMFTGSYSTNSIKAMVDSPQDREAAARAAVEALGGKLHGFYFTFGPSDVIAIGEFDSDVDMAALALAVGADGGVANGATTKLLTSAEAMAAMRQAKKVRSKYKSPTARPRKRK